MNRKNMLNILGSTYLGRDRIIFTARKRSCGKVMFLQVSVILFTGGACSRGGACSQSGGVSAPGGRGVWSGGVPAHGGCLLGGCLLLGGVCSGGGASGPGGVPGGDPPRLLLRAVRILLECILVYYFIFLEQQPTFFRYLFLHLTTQ